MPLTRHFYEMDEVLSAQQVCLRNNWVMQALFWTYELVVSAEPAAACDGLRETWLRWGGGHDPTLIAIQEKNPKTVDDWILLVCRTCAAISAAGSLTAERFLTTAAMAAQREGTTPTAVDVATQTRRRERAAAFIGSLGAAESITTEDAAQFWISLDSACRQGSRRDAFWLLQAVQPILSADAIWSALHIAVRGEPRAEVAAILRGLQASAGPHPVRQILYQAAALLIHCTPTAERPAMLAVPAYIHTVLPRYQREWAAWSSVVGRRVARIYAIPSEALHVGTTRGSLAQRFTNIHDVRDPLYGLIDGCRWWRSTLQEAGIIIERVGTDIHVEFPDDDTLEAFYDRHFPDDIPDEWSAADQQKSHGIGVQERAPSAPVPISVREEPVSSRAWDSGIACGRGRGRDLCVGATARMREEPLHLHLRRLDLNAHV